MLTSCRKVSLVLLGAGVLLTSSTSIASATVSWKSYKISDADITFALPASWKEEAPPPNSVFGARDLASAFASTDFSASVASTPGISTNQFRQIAIAALRKPTFCSGPRLTTSVVELVAGSFLKVVLNCNIKFEGTSLPGTWVYYDVLHKAHGYSFLYQTLSSLDKVELPLFVKSANSIRFIN